MVKAKIEGGLLKIINSYIDTIIKKQKISRMDLSKIIIIIRFIVNEKITKLIKLIKKNWN